VDAQLAAVHHRLDTDLGFFAEHAPLMVKSKTGELVVWRLNRAQLYMQLRAEDQLRRKGWVRLLLLKGRQQGGSTWVNGRFYHHTSRRRGISSFILSHEGNTTNKLMDMVRRFYENSHGAIKPELGKDNPRALTFPGLGSDYAAGTAGNEQVGRGGTAQRFHGSEAAYWEHAYAIQDGALKSIALMPGTEIILESTANGPVGLFYEKCMQALKGEGDYELVFVPWFWQEEYERAINPREFVPTTEEEEFMRVYFAQPFPLDSAPITRAAALRKMAWRRAEIVDLSTGDNIESGRAKFRTIYPSNPIEAFQSTGVGLFRPDAIISARKSNISDETAPRIAGVDPAGDSDNADRTVIAIRQGRHLEKTIKYTRMRPMELAGILAKLIEVERLDMVFIDRGYGEGTIDRLNEMGFGRRVQGVAFNERTLYPDIYLNKRSEMLIECSKWLNAGDVRIPDDDDVHAAFACIPLDEETSNGLKFIKTKREIKRGLGGARLLDIVDAAALTFAYPVRRGLGAGGWRKEGGGAASPGGFTRVSSPLSSFRRLRGGRS
jgi:hypothetical protein